MIQTTKTILLIFMVCCIFWIIIKYLKWGLSGRVLLWSSVSGLILMSVIYVVGENNVPTIPVNPYTVVTSGVLGIPGVILLVLTKIIWQL